MEFPAGPEEITATWLTDTLRQEGTLTHGRVTACAIKVLDGDKGALGQIAQLSLSYDTNPADSPHSIIAKFPTANPEFRAMMHQGGWYEREIRFYQELADTVTLRTPHCYFGALNAETGEFILLLEDLAPARNGSRTAGCSPAEAEIAVREIAKFHATWWDDPRLAQESSLWSPSATEVLQMMQALYQECWDPFVAKMAPDLPKSILTLGQQAKPKVAGIFAQFGNPPHTLVHNDYMLDNLFFGAADSPFLFAVADWQLFSRGYGMRDVGSFLGGNVSIENRRIHEMDLLRLYHGVLAENGVSGYSFAQCVEAYRFSMYDGLLRMVIAIGSGSLREEQERAHREAIWPRYCAALLDLNVAELLPK